MKIWKNVGLIVAIVAIATGLGIVIHHRWSAPSDEITRAKLNELIDGQRVVRATITPTPYPGIYTVEGAWKSGPNPAKFSITTHLEEAQVKALLDASESKVEVPGRSANKGQWVNIISTLVIAGLVVFVVTHQSRLGRAKRTNKTK